MKRDRDLLEIFDAVLPRLSLYCIKTDVPKAGGRELELHELNRSGAHDEFKLAAGITAGLGTATWLLWVPWIPFWFLAIFLSTTIVGAGITGRHFLKLAVNRQPERCLPDGTDVASARLENGVNALIRDWNFDAHFWNEAVAKLRLEISGWQLLNAVPAARDIEWTEQGSHTQKDALLEAARGLVYDRAALIARKDEIDHRLRTLDARLLRLKAADETIIAALPPGKPEDPPDDG